MTVDEHRAAVAKTYRAYCEARLSAAVALEDYQDAVARLRKAEAAATSIPEEPK